ncbi:MAG: GNAT family N-acetyltransferase [Limisphaerales bacterium]
MTKIIYKTGNNLDLDAAIEVYADSGLGERRPVNDRKRMGEMLRHANLVISAWSGDEMIGIARSLTDWVYVTYLSDLAVKKKYQRLGIGRELIKRTREACDPKAMLLLLAVPAAEKYYPHIGFAHHPQAWMIPGEN